MTLQRIKASECKAINWSFTQRRKPRKAERGDRGEGEQSDIGPRIKPDSQRAAGQ